MVHRCGRCADSPHPTRRRTVREAPGSSERVPRNTNSPFPRPRIEIPESSLRRNAQRSSSNVNSTDQSTDRLVSFAIDNTAASPSQPFEPTW